MGNLGEKSEWLGARVEDKGLVTDLMKVYRRMLDHFGPQNWWPGESRFEIAVGAILTQNTNWQNVEKAIAGLRGENLLDPAALIRVPLPRLAELIRPVGYYNLKSRRLLNFVGWLVTNHQGDMDLLRQHSTDRLRGELLSLNGIGPETADSILLYALDKPVFVIDAYTRRVAARHGWIDPALDYHSVQEFFSSVAQDVSLLNEYHALMVQLGKSFCKAHAACCGDCPLEPLLPDGRIVEWD